MATTLTSQGAAPNISKPKWVSMGGGYPFPLDPREAWAPAVFAVVALTLATLACIAWWSDAASIVFSILTLLIFSGFSKEGTEYDIAGIYWGSQLVGGIGPNPGKLWTVPYFGSVKFFDSRRPELLLSEIKVLLPGYDNSMDNWLNELARLSDVTTGFQLPQEISLTRPIPLKLNKGEMGEGGKPSGSHLSYKFGGIQGFLTIITTEGSLARAEGPMSSVMSTAITEVLQKTPYFAVTRYYKGVVIKVQERAGELLLKQNGHNTGSEITTLTLDIEENLALNTELENKAKAEIQLDQAEKFDIPKKKKELQVTYQIEAERLELIIKTVGGQSSYLALTFVESLAKANLNLTMINMSDIMSLWQSFMGFNTNNPNSPTSNWNPRNLKP